MPDGRRKAEYVAATHIAKVGGGAGLGCGQLGRAGLRRCPAGERQGLLAAGVSDC
jgi:hypothetical protein